MASERPADLHSPPLPGSSLSARRVLSPTEDFGRGVCCEGSSDREDACCSDRPTPGSCPVMQENSGEARNNSVNGLIEAMGGLDLGEDPGGADRIAGPQSPFEVPGAKASSIRIHSLWHSLIRQIQRSGTRFAKFFNAMQREPQGAERKCSTASAWPMPLPFNLKGAAPENAGTNLAFLKLINLQVGFLNFLYLDRPDSPPSSICGFAGLTDLQRRIVSRLQRLSGAWNDFESITPEDMGRVAAKQERQESVLRELGNFATPIVQGLKKYQRVSAGVKSVKPVALQSRKVGQLKKGDISGAQGILASRIKMEGLPSFDPVPFLDESSKSLFVDPWRCEIDPSSFVDPPPRVRVHASMGEKVALLKKLEATGRLEFRRPSEVVERFGNGLFCVPKSMDVDRLILDGRPANLLQDPPNTFIYTMASAGCLLGIHLRPEEKLLMSGDDLSNFFYTFRVGYDRVSRNFLEWKIPIKIAKEFKSFPLEYSNERYVYACLATLAMGDSAACAYAQTSHISLGLQCGAFSPQHLVTLHGKIPRGDFFAGIIIDDFVLLEKVARDAVAGAESSKRRSRMQKMYNRVKLDAHPTKGFADKGQASFWGADVDGEEGLIRGSVVRAISLCWVTARVAALGVCSVNLLEVLTGGFVSLFGFRRRMMSLLDLVYVVQGGRDEKDIVSLPSDVVDELWSLVILTPLAVTDLRADFHSHVYMVDASSWGDAVVSAPLGRGVAEEIHRHGVAKSTWTRLLAPFKAVQREKGLLPVEDELPAGEECFSSHPLWECAARGLSYQVVWKKKAKSGRHINIGELGAMVKAEELAGMCQEDCRVPIGSDSQVSLGAVCKGRSASPSLNKILRRSLPNCLGLGIYSSSGYIPSAFNPSDDPTRGVALRDADIELPDWWHSLMTGKTQLFDDFLLDCGLHPERLAGYPSLNRLCTQELSVVDPELKHGRNRQHRKVRLKLKLRHKILNQEVTHDSRDHDILKSIIDKGQKNNKECVELLISFGKEQFIFGTDTSWPPIQPGFIDLFSGKNRGFAKASARFGAPWCLCIDVLDGPQCDLLDRKVRTKIEKLVSSGWCLHLSATPLCSTFSSAITPAVRSTAYLQGFPWLKGAMLQNVEDGNGLSQWLAGLVALCLGLNILFWLAHPDSSYLWRQVCWLGLGAGDPEKFFKVDFCTYNTIWRKRTRFLMNSRLRGARRLCRGGHKHLVLRGRSTFHNCALTKAAAEYPRALCSTLAHAACNDLGLYSGPDGDCCFCSHRRIGEAKNPGPRHVKRAARNLEDLEKVELIRPETVALGRLHWNKFVTWLQSTLDSATIQSLWLVPALLGSMLAAYGRFWYGEGGPLYAYRHLLIYCQRTYPSLRRNLPEAWNLISRWEELEPVTHRRPLPLAMVQAMAVLALRWGWRRVAAVILITFHACARPGEVLRASRRHLVLPEDIGDVLGSPCFLKISRPKPGRRGLGRVQHAKIRDAQVSKFLSDTFRSCIGSEYLYPGSGGAFRTRWNTLLRVLGVPGHFHFTPGCLRAGGTVYLYKQGTPIMDILWMLRLKNLETLQHYLQEISTEVTMIDLPVEAKSLISSLSLLFAFSLSANQL